MPRRRKAARAFRSERPAEKEVREIVANPWMSGYYLDAESFYKVFPKPELRETFARIYPEEFYRVCHFESRREVSPADSEFSTNVFNRPRFMEFIRERGKVDAFEMPSLLEYPYRERAIAHARARAAWWVRNKLPLTPKEMEWLAADTGDDSCRDAFLAIAKRHYVPVEIKVAPMIDQNPNALRLIKT